MQDRGCLRGEQALANRSHGQGMSQLFSLVEMLDVVFQSLRVATPIEKTRLARVITRHHVEMNAAYPARRPMPTDHWLHHLPEQAERDGGILENVLKLERKHKDAKHVANMTPCNETFDRTVMVRMISLQLAALEEADACSGSEIALRGQQVSLLPGHGILQQLRDFMVADRCRTAQRAVVHGLPVNVSDVLIVRAGAGEQAVRAHLFLWVEAAGSCKCYVLGQRFRAREYQRYGRTSTVCREEATLQLNPLGDVVASAIFAQLGDDTVVLWHGLAQ